MKDIAIAGNGCESQLTEVTLNIHPLPDETLNAVDDEICEGSSATITVENTQNGVSYWLRRDDNDSNVAGPLSGPTSGCLVRCDGPGFCRLPRSDVAGGTGHQVTGWHRAGRCRPLRVWT